MTDDHDHDHNHEYVCEECGEAFNSEEALRRHVREIGIVE